ncbi:UNKNOWN [Stylonychia lemnae]|uniref:Uncharacterized protein n=1 Tax=Stylonychia lemnae TaxID=5949 RepID=A0A078ABM4_STYLE|nr:UNKNOWN [Stylonychia lemnae]|eukprot:CDW79271.1 UNKNOWN [Stylonychia lemnae]
MDQYILRTGTDVVGSPKLRENSYDKSKHRLHNMKQQIMENYKQQLSKMLKKQLTNSFERSVLSSQQRLMDSQNTQTPERIKTGQGSRFLNLRASRDSKQKKNESVNQSQHMYQTFQIIRDNKSSNKQQGFLSSNRPETIETINPRIMSPAFGGNLAQFNTNSSWNTLNKFNSGNQTQRPMSNISNNRQGLMFQSTHQAAEEDLSFIQMANQSGRYKFQSARKARQITNKNFNHFSSIHDQQSILMSTSNLQDVKLKQGLTQRTQETNEELQQYLEKLQMAEINSGNYPKNLDQIDSTENIHQNLMVGRPIEVEVIEEQPAYCRINPKGYKSPAIFHIDYRGETAKRQVKDVKIYASTIHREPSDAHCEKQFANEVIDDYIGGGRKKIVTIRELQINEEGKEVEVEVIHDLRDIEENFDQLLKDHDKSMRRIQPQDFVNKNKILMKKWNEIKDRKLKAIKGQISTHCNQVSVKKSRLEEYERKKKYFLLHKWEIIKVKKQEMIEVQMKKIQRLTRSSELAKMILISKIIKEIYQVFNQNREKKRFEEKRVLMQKRIGKFYKRVILRKGVNVSERNSNILRQKASMKSRIEFLKEYWEKEKISLTKYFVANKKNAKKLKPYLTKLAIMNEQIRDVFVENYMIYAMTQFSIRFIIWRTQKLRFMQVQNIEDKTNELNRLQKLLKVKTALLFDELDPFLEEMKVSYIQSLLATTLLQSHNGISPLITPTLKHIISRDHKALSMNADVRANLSNFGQDSSTKGSKSKKQMNFLQAIIQKDAIDPGHSPAFLFLPQKKQLIIMILKALNYNSADEIV